MHRGGRSARMGNSGNNLLLLTPSETTYIGFIQKYEYVALKELKLDSWTGQDVEVLRKEIVEMASNERFVISDVVSMKLSRYLLRSIRLVHLLT